MAWVHYHKGAEEPAKAKGKAYDKGQGWGGGKGKGETQRDQGGHSLPERIQSGFKLAPATYSRSDLAASLPPCPQQWLDRAGTLTAAANLDGRERILRAWQAGAWAQLVLQGLVATPAASRQLNIPSRYYAVIGGENTRPALYRSFKDYSSLLCCCPRGMASAIGAPGLEEVLLYESSHQLYLYEHPSADGDGVQECMAVVVTKRDHGLLLGVPRGLLADAEVAAGLAAPMEELLGPSTVVSCDAASLLDGTLVRHPGRQLTLTLVDVSAEALVRLTPMEPDEPPELLITFDSGAPELLPDPGSLAAAAQTWTTDPAASAFERVTFYSADEAPATAATDPAKKGRAKLHLSRADMEASAQKPGTGSAEPAAKPKRPSVAGLASQLETLMGVLPALTARLDGMDQRQQELSHLVSTGAAAPLRRPLGDPLGSTAKVPPMVQAKLGPPPLALTSLVQQLATASADPVLDLGAAGSVGVRGASQRAHFQDELAQGKGVFFRQVLQNLARRMAPSQAVTGSPASMLEQGLTLSRYWERFGGWSNARDMALVAYQVGLIFDAMMAERCELAKDHLALLAVSLEQSSLDGSRMDIGYQLTWLEEPPSSMFMARSSHNPRGRAFAPLASQRWITVVLAFLKELDTIQARRGDRPGGSGLVCPGSCPTPAAYSDQLGPNEALQAQVAQSISTTISFADFSASLPRWLLRSRTPFGAFVASTFSSPCGRLGNAPASAVLPLPLPYLALFECSGPRLPRAKWRRLRSRRLLHIMVCAVNFVFCRGSRPSQEALWRAPNTHQRNCYVRLGAFITACESREDRFPLPPGRSGFDLLARLLELEAFASSVLGSSSYAGPAGPSREALPQLQPYRALNVSRLRLHGTGEWRLESFLQGPLWLPFLDPLILRHGFEVALDDLPDLEKESREECLRLALLWDAKGLLDLRRPLPSQDAFARSCRIFNSYKNEALDRQIGDRRYREKLCGFASDRKDFYHQFFATSQRSDSNRVPFSYPASCFAGTRALLALSSSYRGGPRSPKPLLHGDAKAGAVIGQASRPCPAPRDSCVSASTNRSRGLGESAPGEGGSTAELGFRSSGPSCQASAEALSAHRDSCESASTNRSRGPWPYGLAKDTEVVPSFKSMLQGDHHGVEFALEGHRQLLRSYGAISPQSELLGGESPPLTGLWQAVVIDDLVNLSSVPVSATSAEGSEGQSMHNLALEAYASEAVAGAPEKDVVGEQLFEAIGAEIDSRDPQISRGCVPVARRVPLAALSLRAAALPVTTPCLLNRLAGAQWPSSGTSSVRSPGLNLLLLPRLPQPRLLAQELCLAAALMPVMASNIAAPFSENTDASLGLGAFCSTESHRLAYPFVSTWLRQSPFFNLKEPDLLAWFYAVLKEGLVRALVLHSPVVLAPIAGPVQRAGPRAAFSKDATRYWRRCQFLARRARFLLCAAARFGRPVLLLERGPPLDSGAPSALAPTARNFAIAACAFGCPTCCSVSAWAASLDTSPLERPCLCSSATRAASLLGSPRKAAQLPAGLAWHAAKTFCSALRRPAPEATPSRLESIVCNDLLTASRWKVECVIPWKGRHHINVLELSTLGALLRSLATQAPDSRVTALLDSVVAKAAAAKGRSTSFALSPALSQACAVQLAYGIYASFGFAPTRLNTADAPSRGQELAPPAETSLISLLPIEALHGLGSHRLSRSLASWARLFLVAVLRHGPPTQLLCDSLAGRHAPLAAPYVADCRRDFDSSLGFPGEGPFPSALAICSRSRPLCTFGCHGLSFSLSQLALCEARALTNVPLLGPHFLFRNHRLCNTILALTWVLLAVCPAAGPCVFLGFDSTLGFPGEGWVWLLVFWGAFRVDLSFAMDPAAPRTPADAARAEARRPLHLVADRAERISTTLVQYGQQLFRAGSPYYRYSETRNGVGAARPGIRRSLSSAWDLAFAWLAEEPHAHHRALPRGVLLAIVSASLAWGWLREAALFMLAWAGLLRIGEAIAATRRDLILPSDAAPGTTFALLQIRSPKTRGRAAKHQASHIDPPDVIHLLELAFGPLRPSARLWPMSSGALRRRFRLLQARFGLVNSDGSPHFDLSSFRPGGATWMLHCTENPDLVRRRGRWLSLRVMEIYLQEVEAITYLPSLSTEQRDFLKLMAEAFPVFLQKATFLQKARLEFGVRTNYTKHPDIEGKQGAYLRLALPTS
ncbi:hypothetical protein AK812_SmicGene42825 [Symbiodinium microadriaticum]|uniref:Uncharacterized protein n=1 Tax=Symbiodinium microadriaticum TaxID=2951 RepID=A0A1Q9C2L4_SYMMI|nr:hypothetical protein AK812_SmicGene42825 [Symbiodinium microadriaticum]